MTMLIYIVLLLNVIYSTGLNTSELNDSVQSNGSSDQSQLEIVENYNILSSFNSDNDSNNIFHDKIHNSTVNYNESNSYGDDYLFVAKNNSNRPIEKIDVLSKLLRVHVDYFRDNTDRVEMVFLVDASSSVGSDNFKSELNFVRKLLSDLKVEQSATRVAVVTFAGKGMVKRNIDQISSNQIIGNKCTLLNEQLKNVEWSGGGTYTRGALLEALTILRESRPDAKKVVFLITDGFSNGGDPRPIAQMLKNIGTIILTFGICTGKIDELRDIASEPGDTHSYLLDSFTEFEAMARRALHRDLKPGQYIPSISPQSCNVFCNTTTNTKCCDKLAECNCATTSGHYTCLCPLGYFGTGLQGSCHPCPNSTYGFTKSPGDSSSNCLPCPSANHITLKVPSTSINDCICATGFIKNGTSCDSITCPKLRVPENGYLVKANACTNVVNAACGLRCQIGFRLIGDSIRLCGNNGAWSGTETQCILKTCPTPRPPIHGRVQCEYDDEYDYISPSLKTNITATALPIDARCQFKCNHGYQLLGSKVRNCLPVSRWDGLKVTCKQIKCEPLSQLPNGIIIPEICTGIKKLEFSTKCSFTCLPGFELRGPASRRCIGSSGLWSQRHTISQCIDSVPPVIKCPDNSTWTTLPGKRYALPTWTSPIATDNSEKPLNVWVKPHLTFPWKSKIGSHSITYIAEDSSGNRARCRFNVVVVDNEAPVIENCIDPPIFLSRNIKGADNVTWDEPNFYDNSGKKVMVQKSAIQGSFFPIGVTKVVYSVTDKSGNVANCILNVTVENMCKNLPIVDNGRANCDDSVGDNIQCAITCEEGYLFPLFEHNYGDDNYSFNCHVDGYNNNVNNNSNWNGLSFPSCSITEVPKSIEFGGSIILETNSTLCNEPTINIEHLKTYISEDLSMNINNSCNENGIDCRLSKIDFNCETISKNDIKIHERKRKSLTGMQTVQRNKTRIKRKRDKMEVKFWFIAKIIAENQNNSQRGVEKLRDELEKMTKSGNLNLLDERTNREVAKLALNIRTIFNDEFKGQCYAGSFYRKEKCIKCPAGTFSNALKNYCTSCNLGEYQDKIGATSCKKCPEGTSTKRIHSIHIRDCIRLCSPGFYSKRKYHRDQLVSMEPCSSCDTGYYQPFYGERQCRPCPGNATTISRGTINLQDCIHIQDSCTQNSCLNNGQCIRELNGYSCDCPKNYIGSRCEIKRDPCEITPCLNGGICITTKNPSNYHCNCPKKFTGLHCEQYIDECLSNPCRNNGTCISNENDFSCNCTDNFAGEFCDIPQNLCDGICEEGSTCSIIDGTWHCHCQPGYLGRRCQLVPCDWLPCHPNSICINIPQINATHESYECKCPIGYTGHDCSTQINHCHNSPCLNDGLCINNLFNYTCKCGILFDGLNCEIKLSSDFILHFVKPGTSDYILMNGPEININELTMCLWLQSMDTLNYGTVFSYATENNDNTITLTDYNGFVFYINGDNVVTDISLNDGSWHFICVSWQSLDGNWTIYVDGVLKDWGEGLATGSTIVGNGSVVIGQEQDFIKGGFSISESFLGRLTLLDVWSEILSENLINNLSKTCDNYHGNIISWSSVKKYVHGDIEIVSSNFCHGCDTPIAPLHGNTNISENSLEVVYSCELGYNLRMENRIYDTIKRECMKNGEWNGNGNFKCVKINCGFPGYFPRGKIHGNSYLFGDVIYYTCNDGFVLRGNSHRVCNSDKYWSGRPPICIGITCKSLLAPEHGDIEYIIEEHERDDVSILQVGQQLEFKCDLGYEIIGDKLLTCMKSGEWSYSVPYCQSIGCQTPPQLQHGYINYNKNNTKNIISNNNSDDSDNSTMNYHKHGEIVAFSCDDGYKFQGNNTQSTIQMLKCFNNGSWIGTITDCIPIECPWPSIQNGNIVNRSEIDFNGSTVGSELSIVCDKGFASSNDNVTCSVNGKWIPEVSDCLPRKCSSLSNHPIGNLFIGKRNNNSNLNKNNVDEFDSLKHLTLAIEGDKFADKFTLQCNDNTRKLNFNNNSNELIFDGISWECDEEGDWRMIDDFYMDDDELREFLKFNDVCMNEITCPMPIIPSNGYLIDVEGNERDHWRMNESVSYKCRKGYEVDGDGIIFCMENGTWTNVVECKLVNCLSPPIINNAELILESDRSDYYVFGDVVEYNCLSGYRLFGSGSVRCLANRKWSRMQGKCGRISCGKPNVGDGVLLDGKSYLYRDELGFRCSNGELNGTIVCRDDGNWSSLPSCNN